LTFNNIFYSSSKDGMCILSNNIIKKAKKPALDPFKISRPSFDYTCHLILKLLSQTSLINTTIVIHHKFQFQDSYFPISLQ
jgi:hypothetical protein